MGLLQAMVLHMYCSVMLMYKNDFKTHSNPLFFKVPNVHNYNNYKCTLSLHDNSTILTQNTCSSDISHIMYM